MARRKSLEQQIFEFKKAVLGFAVIVLFIVFPQILDYAGKTIGNAAFAPMTEKLEREKQEKQIREQNRLKDPYWEEMRRICATPDGPSLKACRGVK